MTANLNERTLNLLLEQIFLLSVRKDSILPLKYIEIENESFLNVKNLNNIILIYLNNSNEEKINSIIYLLSCYRRLIQREISVNDKIKDDFNKYIYLLLLTLLLTILILIILIIIIIILTLL